MVNRTNQKAREIDKFSETDTAVLNYQPLPSQKIHFNETLFNDDVIAALANAYENRRARQVVEWERLYRPKVAG